MAKRFHSLLWVYSLYIVFFRFIRKNLCKYAHACMTNPTVSSVSCSIYGKTRAKYTTDAQPQQCQYAIIPCFYVCYEKVALFTVFHRIKWAFHNISFLHVFYRVNHKRGSQTGPPNGSHLKYFGRDRELFNVFYGVFSFRHQETHVFYRVKWLKNRPTSHIEKRRFTMWIYTVKHG